MSALVLEPAVQQLELLRSGQISVAELAEAHIRQIERLNPTLNALVDFDAERARTLRRTAMYSHGPMAFRVARIDNWPALRRPT